MKFRYILVPLLSAALQRSVSSASAVLNKRSLTPPSEDPFYSCPDDSLQSPPGTIVRHRLTPVPLAKYEGQPSNVKATYQLLYRSTNSHDQPECAVTTVIVPDNADYTKVLSYQSAYDSSNVDCSPSFQFLRNATFGANFGIIDKDELAFIAQLLAKGWVVNVPDFEGLTAAFEAGFQTGYATLDSVRAVLQSGSITGVSPDATYAMWGYSGGSFASNWASELQPGYAPELSFAGTAAGGITPNLTSVFLTINKQPAAGLAVSAILGMAKQYANLSDYLDTHLVKSTASTFRLGRRECFKKVGAQFANQDISKYFTDGADFISDPVITSVTTVAALLGRFGPPQMPLYFYKAVHDEISPIADTDALVKTYCAEGVDVQYVRNSKGDHEQEAVYGAPGALTFLEYVMDGGQVSKGCNITNVSIT